MTIEITDELLQAFGEARAALNQEQQHGRPPKSEDEKRRAGLAAVLAIVERDRCLEAKGHVFHPLAKPQPGPCSVSGPSFNVGQPLSCDLRHGHEGDHETNGGTRWRYTS